MSGRGRGRGGGGNPLHTGCACVCARVRVERACVCAHATRNSPPNWKPFGRRLPCSLRCAGSWRALAAMSALTAECCANSRRARRGGGNPLHTGCVRPPCVTARQL
jgi:hypothetical protein